MLWGTEFLFLAWFKTLHIDLDDENLILITVMNAAW